MEILFVISVIFLYYLLDMPLTSDIVIIGDRKNIIIKIILHGFIMSTFLCILFIPIIMYNFYSLFMLFITIFLVDILRHYKKYKEGLIKWKNTF